MKPCTHHTVAVVAAASATKGRAKLPAAAKPNDARSSERLETFSMPFLPYASRDLLRTRVHCRRQCGPFAGPVQRLAEIRSRRGALRERAGGAVQACWIGYFAKIASMRLHALSAASSGFMPPVAMSAQATFQTCSVMTCA